MLRIALAALLLAQDIPEGLELWLDATALPEGPVAVWKDRSGRDRHLTPVDTVPTRLKEGMVRFDGRGQRLQGKGGFEPENLTLVVVFAVHSSDGGFRALFSAGIPTLNDYETGLNVDFGAQGDSMNVEGRGLAGQSNLLTQPLTRGDLHIAALTIGKDCALILDGVPAGRRARTGAKLNFDQIRVGARRYAGVDSGFLEGDIAELMLFGRVLGQDEIATLTETLRKKHPKAAAVVPRPQVTMLSPGFTVKKLPVKLTNINNLEYAPDGRLFALGYDGRLHVLADTDGDGVEDAASLYYDGEGDLRAPIGMALTPEGIYVASKGKVSLIKEKGSEVVAQGWKQIQHGVDALGVAVDAKGNLFFGLGCHDFTNIYKNYDLKSERGTILKVAPDRQSREIVCTGIRFPVALAFNKHGDLFATEQEGETWCPGGNPLDKLMHIRPGRHYAFPPKLPGIADEPATVSFGPQHQSTCGLKFNTGFGPPAWHDDAIVTGFSRGKLWRVPLSKTSGGYVGRPVQIASLTMMPIDIAISAKGDLVVSCHSGGPDWGTGPKGPGSLFKISYGGAPQPVAVWAAGPMEVRVAYDRPVELDEVKGITFGEYVGAADPLEVFSPPYKVVEEQKRSPRYSLPVVGRRMSEDRRTLIITTRPHPTRANYALSLGASELLYDLSGVEATWAGGGETWSGWLPHVDPSVVATQMRGSAEHERFLELIRKPGKLVMRTNKETVELATGPGFKHEVFVPLDALRLPWEPAARPPKAPVKGASEIVGGDWARGKSLFFGDAKCGSCHTVRGEGGKSGPDLSNLIHLDPKAVLRDILEPNATINPDYASYRVELKSGDVLAGIVHPDGADRIRLVGPNAEPVGIAKADIRDLRPSSISLMPEGFKLLGDEKLKDLLTFLTVQEGKSPPQRSREEVEAALAKTVKSAVAPRPLKVLLVANPKDHGPGEHDYPAWQKGWKPLLEKVAKTEVATAFPWPTEEQWAAADVAVLYLWGKWDASQLKDVDGFLSRGGGLVVLHSATIPKAQPLELAARIGLAWEPGRTKFRHGPLELSLIEHDLTAGLPARVKFVDESYWPLVGDLKGGTVLATQVEDGAPRPMAWIVEVGKGRAFSTLLGHYSWTFDDPFFRILVLRGMAWAAREPLDRFESAVTR